MQLRKFGDPIQIFKNGKVISYKYPAQGVERDAKPKETTESRKQNTNSKFSSNNINLNPGYYTIQVKFRTQGFLGDRVGHQIYRIENDETHKVIYMKTTTKGDSISVNNSYDKGFGGKIVSVSYDPKSSNYKTLESEFQKLPESHSYWHKIR